MFTTAPLFGRFHSSCRKSARRLRGQTLHHLESLCAARIGPELLAPNPGERERLYTSRLTFLAFLDQILNPGASCRRAVDQIRAYYQAQPHPPALDANTSAYCQARGRWQTAELAAIRRHLAQRMALYADTLLDCFRVERPLKVIDGTCLNLPDTPANRAACPQSADQAPGCGFPLLRLVGIFCLKTGMLLEEHSAPHTSSENVLFQELWPTLHAGDVLVGDRNFSSSAALASLLARGVDGIYRLNANRSHDLRRGKPLGPMDRQVIWKKPTQKPPNLTAAQWAALPQTLTVRVLRVKLRERKLRCRTLTLVTTLLDAQRWPAALLAAIYARRWKIELYWDDIKTTLQMDMLSCRSPAMIHRELQMHFTAYNLIRSLMAEAALHCHVSLDRVSFKGTLDAAQEYSRAINQIPRRNRKARRRLYLEMLTTIASALVPERLDRREPRCQKRRPEAYPFMTRPRKQMKDRPKNRHHQKNSMS